MPNLTKREIPEHKQMEQEQARRCKRMAHMISLLGVYDLNIQTGEGLVSEEYVKMLGYSPSEFQKTNEQFLLETGPQWLNRIHPDDKAAVSQTLAEYTSGMREAHCIGYRQQTKSGGWLSILSTGKLVSLAENEPPVHLIGTHTVINDIKRPRRQWHVPSTGVTFAL